MNKRTAAAVAAAATAAIPMLLAAPAGAATPPRPSALRVTNGGAGTWLTWTASGATRFQVQQATDRSFKTGTRIYTLRDGRDRQFTPTGLTAGTTYFWRVRAVAGSTASPYSAPVTAVPVTREQRLRVYQFNISNEDGQREPGGTVLPWSERRAAVAGIIAKAHPDVVAVEEAADWANQPRGPRRVDDLVALLGASYSLARTEVPPGEPGWFRTGTYLIYNSDAWQAVGAGGHWSVGNPAWEVYQLLRNRTTGAELLLIGAHIAGDGGSAGDAKRRSQTQTVIQNARGYAASHGNVPVVYAGDFNSHEGPGHAFDGPGVATRAAAINDSATAAQAMANARYNSANDYYRSPPAHARYLDRIFAPPGVGVLSWRQWLNLAGGRFAGVIPSDHNPISADLTLPY